MKEKLSLLIPKNDHNILFYLLFPLLVLYFLHGAYFDSIKIESLSPEIYQVDTLSDVFIKQSYKGGKHLIFINDQNNSYHASCKYLPNFQDCNQAISHSYQKDFLRNHCQIVFYSYSYRKLSNHKKKYEGFVEKIACDGGKTYI